jgi:flagellar motor switch protein FliN
MSNSSNYDIILAIKTAVVDLFDTMLSMEVVPQDAQEAFTTVDDSLMVGFVSLAGKVNGSVDIRVTSTMARHMCAGMLGMAPEEATDDEAVKDVLREACNIVAGGLKSSFCDAGLTCEISTPSITTGSNFEIQTLHMERYERFVFAYQDQRFEVEVAVKFQSEDEADLESILKLKKIDLGKFQRLDIISSVGDSIIELFDTMLSLDVELSDREPFTSYEDFRVMGAVNFTGSVQGSIQFQVPKTFGRMIAAGMLGMELEEIQDIETVKDVIGEMTNILGGNLKAAFCDSGLNCQISTPSLTVGLDFHIEILNMDRYEKFAFKLNDHDILVEICVKIDEAVGAEVATRTSQSPKAGGRLDETAIQAMLQEASSGAPAANDNSPLNDDQIQALLAANASKPAPPQVEPAPVKAPPAEAVQTTPAEQPAGVSANSARDAEAPADDTPSFDVGFIRDIPVHITVELGRKKMAIKNILGLGKGAAIVLANLEGEALDIRANNRLIAKGEVLVENDKYGIRIKEIVTSQERLDRLIG